MIKRALPFLFAFGLASRATAQWSADPAQNQALAAASWAEDQAKLAATEDGGFFVSWFGSDPGGSPPLGFDVWLQRLDARGAPLWATPTRVADRGFSSTQDYGLDALGDTAVLAFRDDRATGVQITAARVDSAGSLSWSVQLTATTEFVAAPKITATADGAVVCAWTQGSVARVRKLGADGTFVWPADVVLDDPSADVSLSDVRADDAGGALVLLVRQASFLAPRHLELLRLDASGAELFRTTVLDGGSLQFGNFPTFLHDGSGGAVLAWYTSSPTLECYVQRVLADGTELFSHDGLAVAVDPTHLRVSPSVVFDATTGVTTTFYTEQDLLQSQSGVSGQSFDASGNRLWGSTGAVLEPIQPSTRSGVRAVRGEAPFLVAWVDEPAFGQATIRSAVVDAGGNALVGPFALASTPSTKFRLEAALSCVGFGAFVWRDERAGNADVFAQDLGTDGTLGPIGQAVVVPRNGSGVNPAVFAATSPPVIGQDFQATIALGGFTSSAILVGLGGPTQLPFPGGELLCLPPFSPVDLATGTHAVSLPLQCALVGTTFCLQGMRFSLGPFTFELTNALDATAGSF